ncbi:MAG: GT4 family glycosyltransferase PelF [Deltaproteobacteria bacterium]|nr:GT4 family glycosyltransferase PelF [Deltaproteobacteria bacterium]
MIDVCMILEGTYPYVAGGVSTWVHQLISSMKDLKFGIVYIAPNSDPTRTMKYELPHQVLFMKEIYLHDYDLDLHRLRKGGKKDYALLKNYYQKVLSGKADEFESFLQLFQGDQRCFDLKTLFSSHEAWEILTHFYKAFGDGVSFLDFFWTWRGTHLPIFQILQTELPRAKIYHAISTGYAGLVATMGKILHQGLFFLTEHGIYTHERLLEISQADWIYEQEKKHFRAERDLSFFKKWWIGMFQAMSRLAYQYSDKIVTLYEGNRLRQALEGAPLNKISIIPNGINPKEYQSIQREKKLIPQIGLVGRVVGIKDIRTFVQAAKRVINTGKEASFYIIGPTDEEEDYFEECQTMVEELKLEEFITFTGRVDVKDYYKFLDLVVLTSLSEAQPYVILEANCVGIPVVASDVGACREMLEGTEMADKRLGASGLVTEVSNPESTAQAILKLLNDPSLYQSMSEAGKERVVRYYNQDDLLGRYLNLYEQNL